MTDEAGHTPVLWVEDDPGRMERDRREVCAFAPLMELTEPGVGLAHPHGCWVGEIPRWPFDRPPPAGLDELLGPDRFQIEMEYPSAYPMTPPRIYPANLTPEPVEHSQGVWHVSPDGSLCLLQSTGGWLPEASATEMLQKAAGWRIEYALMKAGAIERMTTNGIVNDPIHDELITRVSEVANSADTENVGGE
jgi:hypothetical protein